MGYVLDIDGTFIYMYICTYQYTWKSDTTHQHCRCQNSIAPLSCSSSGSGACSSKRARGLKVILGAGENVRWWHAVRSVANVMLSPYIYNICTCVYVYIYIYIMCKVTQSQGNAKQRITMQSMYICICIYFIYIYIYIYIYIPSAYLT